MWSVRGHTRRSGRSDTMGDIVKSRRFVLGNDRHRDIEESVVDETDSENLSRGRDGDKNDRAPRRAGSASNQKTL